MTHAADGEDEMTDEDLDKLADWKCVHDYERIMAWGNKHTYGCKYCGSTRTVKVGGGITESQYGSRRLTLGVDEG